MPENKHTAGRGGGMGSRVEEKTTLDSPFKKLAAQKAAFFKSNLFTFRVLSYNNRLL
jgi:hypothetical protein